MPKVRPIPKGYHTVTTGLTVANAAEVIKFCKKAFGAKEIMRMAGPGGSVMHAEIMIGDTRIMLGDEMPGMPHKSAKSLNGTTATLHIYVENCDAVCAKAVKAGATVRMPISQMFWGDRYGVIEDPFGNSWALATHTEDVSPAEMKKRGAKMMKQMQTPPQAASAQA